MQFHYVGVSLSYNQHTLSTNRFPVSEQQNNWRTEQHEQQTTTTKQLNNTSNRPIGSLTHRQFSSYVTTQLASPGGSPSSTPRERSVPRPTPLAPGAGRTTGGLTGLPRWVTWGDATPGPV
jgi:hypothetical protein